MTHFDSEQDNIDRERTQAMADELTATINRALAQRNVRELIDMKNRQRKARFVTLTQAIRESDVMCWLAAYFHRGKGGK